MNLGGRTARATTNKFDEDSLRRVVQSATNLAKVQAADPDLLPMADAAAFDPAGPAPARNYFETSSIGPQERAAAVEKIVEVAQKHKLTTAGIYATAESVEAILNSRGLVVLSHADLGRVLDHHACGGFFRMAEGQLARRAQLRSGRTGRSRS